MSIDLEDSIIASDGRILVDVPMVRQACRNAVVMSVVLIFMIPFGVHA